MLDSAFGSTSPSIVVGRTLSSYMVSGIQNHQETITYTVYNEQATDETGVLLTTTLGPGVTYASASSTPDQSGQNLAWSLGTIAGYDRASVSLTVTLASNPPLQLDSGAKAYAILNADAVSNSTPAATLSTMTIPTGTLDSTPDANTTDPYIQEEAAELNYSPQNIFNFLHTQIGYNSYSGSLRGARGTLWSDAGNSLDVASLGVALMRASGIPAQYVSGILSFSQAQTLILSMFPNPDQTTGSIPTGTTTADPADDSQLLDETEEHYWFQFNTGTGFQNADPLMAGATIGQTFTTATATFTEVPDDLRQKTTVQLVAEITDTADSLFGLSGATDTTVINQTFDDVSLVGRPITVVNLVTTTGYSAVFSATTNTYTPYLEIGDAADTNLSDDTIITGTPYQEFLTNFPYGSEVLTGLFLNITLTDATGASQTYSRSLVDRLGLAARQGGASSPLSVSPTSSPAIGPLDLSTIDIDTGAENPSSTLLTNPGIAAYANLNSFDNMFATASPQEQSDLQATEVATIRNFLIAGERSRLNDLDESMTVATRSTEATDGVLDYLAQPRITIASSQTSFAADGNPQLSFGLDLLDSSVRTVVEPGQATQAGLAFNLERGLIENQLEGLVLSPPSGTSSASGTAGGIVFPIDTAAIFQAASAQGIPIVSLGGDELSLVAQLPFSADVKALIAQELQSGEEVFIPSQAVNVGGQSVIGWYEVDTTTGQASGVLEDGTHGVYDDVVALALDSSLLASSNSGLQFVFGFVAGFAKGGLLKNLALVVAGAIIQDFPNGFDEIVGDASKLKTLYSAATNILKSWLLATDSSLETLLSSDPPLALGYYAGTAASTWFTADPALPTILLSPSGLPDQSNDSDSTTLMVNSLIPAGSVQALLNEESLAISGGLTASWADSSTNGFEASTLASAQAVVIDSTGSLVGSGPLSLSSIDLTQLEISGAVSYQVDGQGSLSFYGPAESRLGVSGDWESYTATAMGNVSIVLTTSGLMLNGQTLPAGTYTITTSSATLAGSGATSSPNFAGSVSIATTGGSVSLGPGTGNATVGGKPLDDEEGAALDGYNGAITVSASGNGTDSVDFAGAISNILAVSATPATLSATQNAPASFTPVVNTSLADSYTITATGPAGWSVSIDDGKVTVTPAAGTQSGTYPIDVTVVSSTDANLTAQTTVQVSVTATQPGISLTVPPDPLLSVPYQNAPIPSAFRASIQNLGPSADTYNLTFSNVPIGFTLQDSGTSVTVPSGATGILGLYLVPNAGSTLPAPGTVLTFEVTATSTTTPSITKTQTVTFTVPAIDAVTLSSSPSSLNITPGVSVADTITITNVGNLAESNIALTDSLSSGLTLTGLAPVTLAVGQSTTETVMVTPSASTPLNSILQAMITATYGASASTQTLTLPVNVVVPGAQVIGSASTAANQLGETDLASRLSDLSTAITNLVQNPTSAVYRSQSVGDVNAIALLVGDDPFLATLAPTLTADGVTLSNAGTADSVQAALTTLNGDLTTLNSTLNDEIEHNFTLTLQTNSLTAQPDTPIAFTIVLQNTGSEFTKYDLSISGLPSDVTASFSTNSVSIGPGQTTTDPGSVPVTVTLTSTSTTDLPAFNFQVIATVDNATEITQSTTGSLMARSEVVSVVSVSTNPPFTDPGGTVSVSARILNAVNETQTARAYFYVTNSSGTTLYQSPDTTVFLQVLTTISTVDLGSFSTSGFSDGIDTIHVVVTSTGGTSFPGTNATGSLQVGSPVTATDSVSPDNLPISSGTVTNTVTVALDPNALAPLSLIGQLDPSGGANCVVVHGTSAYVGGNGVITIVDVSNPSNPTAVGSFGSTDFPNSSVTEEMVSGNDLYVLVNNNGSNTASFLIYSLANPLSPTLLGQTSLGSDSFIENFVLSNDHAYFTGHWLRYYFAGNTIFQQHGEILSVDVTNPADPVDTGVVYNDPPDSGSGYPDGDSYIFQELAVNSDTLLAGSTSATMGTTTGVGQVLVIDTSDPSNPALTSTLDIPGTTLIVAMAMESGNRALLVASTGGFLDGDNDTDPNGNLTFGPSGNLVLITLDLSNPQDPQILSTQDLSRSSRASNNIRLYAVGGDKFVLGSLGATTDQPDLTFIDASGGGDAVVTSLTVPAVSSLMAVSGNDLYTTSTTGLSVYNIGTPTAETPVTIDVLVPNGQTIVPGSFNIAPTSITDGVVYQTIEWQRNLDQTTTTQTFTYQTDVSGLQAGVSQQVTLGTNIAFTSQGTPSNFSLAPLTVVGQQILSISPTSATTQPGQEISYEVNLENPTALAETFNLSVAGVPASWVNIPASETVPAAGEAEIDLLLTPAAIASLGTYGFSVTATADDGTTGSAFASLVVQGVPVEPDSQSHGIVASLTPVSATIGQGSSAQYILQLTNTGSASDTFSLQLDPLTNNDGLNAVFGETSIVIPPGSSNFRDIPLTLTPTLGISLGNHSFTVLVQSTTDSSVSTTTSGTLDLVANGVSESFNQSSVAPGGTLELTVTNTGSVTDTFDLSLGGPAALVSTLGSTKVKLAPGASDSVPITTTAVNFAVQGALGLTAIATSEGDSAVKADATSSLEIPATTGMTAQLTPATQLLPIPGTTSFLLIVQNTGNVEDSYSATLMGANGPIEANLVGLDGSPTDSIPIFRLPGLSTGEIVLQADLTGVGQGTVSVQIQSLTNAAATAIETATVSSTPATTLQLSSSATQVTVGQPITFTAVVSSASSSFTPSGSVVFTFDGVAQAPVALSLVGGKEEATLTTSSLGAGTHQISAAFSGTDFGSSSAGPVSIKVDQGAVNPVVASSLVLSGPSIPVAFGQAVTIIATLTTSSAASTPTGSIVFDVDGVENLSVPIQVINGVAQATLTLDGLSAGLHAVLATYAGDAAVAPSLSPVLLATVNPPIVVPPPVIDGPQVVQVQRYGYHSLPNSFVITFTEALDPSRAQDVANYRIVGLGGVVEPIKSASYNPATMTVTLYPRKSLDLHAIYQLTIVGTGASGVADVSGNLLDGARTGVAGSNYTGLLQASQLVLGSSVPGGPAQLAKIRRELAQIESAQAKELAKQEAAAKKVASKKAHELAVKKVVHPLAKSPVKSGRRR